MHSPISRRAAAFPVIEHDQLDSTNAEAMRRAAADARGPVWILARRQTRGRGRSGRAWLSADGNLAATLLIEPGCPPASLHELSLLAGVAVWDGLHDLARGARVGSQRLRLKWPNDILIDGAKLGGILIESTVLGTATVTAIGIGINVAHAPQVPGRATAYLADLGLDTPPRAVLDAISPALQDWLERWQHGRGFAAIRAAWLERTGDSEEEMSIHAAGAPVTGRFAGLDETGALLLACAGPDGRSRTIRRFTFGDAILASEQAADRGMARHEEA